MEFTIKPVLLHEIVDLRQRILRPKGSNDESYTEEDFYFTTFHFGAFDEMGRLVCCVSFQNENLMEETGGYRLRFMATELAYQGKGSGRELLKYAEKTILHEVKGITYFWCHARVNAISFYEKCGWETVGPEFIITINGEDIPHVRMLKDLKNISMR